MKTQTVQIDSVGKTKLSDSTYIGSGGEGVVHLVNNLALKIFHNSKLATPIQKLNELSKINHDRVLKPLHPVYNTNNVLIGYAMNYAKNTNVLCKYFTKSFCKQNNIDTSTINKLVKEMQTIVNIVHKSNCLIVDFNEMNVLVDSQHLPIFIDVDSWQTPSFKATAIMDSIKDPLVVSNNFNEGSDWFAFAILLCQLYIGIHPYKGKHPKYKMSEWKQRMSDNVSIFDKNVTLPAICHPMSRVPKQYLDWMKSLFVDNKRDVPPSLSTMIVSTIMPKSVLMPSSNFNIDMLYEYDEAIKQVQFKMGVCYALTKSKLFKNKNQIIATNIDNFILCNNEIIQITKQNFYLQLKSKSLNATIKANSYKVIDNILYTMIDSKVHKHEFRVLNNKLIHTSKILMNVSNLTSKMYDGAIHQDLLGQSYVSIFTTISGYGFTFKTQELNNHTIVQMRYRNGHLIVLTSNKGVYNRFHFIIDEMQNTCKLGSIDKDVLCEDVNFIVLNNGLFISLENDNELRLMSTSKNKVMKNSPFNSSMPLMTDGQKVMILNDKTINHISMR